MLLARVEGHLDAFFAREHDAGQGQAARVIKGVLHEQGSLVLPAAIAGIEERPAPPHYPIRLSNESR